MNIILNILGKYVLLVNITMRRVIGLLENDYGLIRYMLKILREYETTIVKGGYILFQNREGEIYLHRIIMEYYSQFNKRLSSILKHPEYFEVNHKNKMVWDNRLDNLEIVTKKGNQNHKMGIDYEDEIEMKTEEIIKIQNELKQEKQYKTDQKYLEKVNRINTGKCSSRMEFFDILYIRFSNKIISRNNIPQNITDSNILEYFTSIFFDNSKNTFLNQNIFRLKVEYDYYRVKNIIKNNKKILLKYYKKNRYFREICKRYRILDLDYKDDKKNIDKQYEVYQDHNILYYFFDNILIHLIPRFYKNQIYVIISVKDLITTYKKYKYFRVLYFLGLLQRREVHYCPEKIYKGYPKKDLNIRKKEKLLYGKQIHIPSGFYIPKYTDELFTSTILPLCEKIYPIKLTKITYTIVSRNWGFDVADKIYQQPRLKKKTERDFKTIDDIISIIRNSTTLHSEIQRYGFITVSKIRNELQQLNIQRKIRKEDYIEIKEKDIKFIVGVIRNVNDIKETLDEVGWEYVRLNSKTIDKIKKHCEKNEVEIEEIPPLKINQTKIVLKNLIVKK